MLPEEPKTLWHTAAVGLKQRLCIRRVRDSCWQWQNLMRQQAQKNVDGRTALFELNRNKGFAQVSP